MWFTIQYKHTSLTISFQFCILKYVQSTFITFVQWFNSEFLLYGQILFFLLWYTNMLQFFQIFCLFQKGFYLSTFWLIKYLYAIVESQFSRTKKK